eukprot:TRINITY_DN29000_c0_g1_i1.p1 TRINITY_DN29000_c0_g1~~TRINITY_DN29000_c0_g1_i1.p1  ORF type:complete len:152 (-),score=28.29 TRINITY_DN29000_c0_g1_i1:215-670(-)
MASSVSLGVAPPTLHPSFHPVSVISSRKPLISLASSLKRLSLNFTARSIQVHPFNTSGLQAWRRGFDKRLPFTVMAAKGYKMKTNKAAAKRFRVTGKGKLMRRRAGKQHLLINKSKDRKKRLSKMAYVDKSDYRNVCKSLPYVKVNKKIAP